MDLINGTSKVLIVDDDTDSRNLILAILEPFAFDMVTAENGHDGFEKFIEWQPSLIITDLQMPVMDGLELIKRIRSAGSIVPIMVISGAGVLLPEATLLGANVVFDKPFVIDEVVASFNKLLG